MKKNLLLMMLSCPAMLAAQDNGVTVSNLAVNTGSPTTVTFDVSWSKTGIPTLWSDTVWVFVDYNDAGVMKRLPVAGATVSAGTVTKIPNNNKGVWIVGDARDAGAFSATVKLFTATADLAGACAYASNYPPVGDYTSATNIAFTGTPDYIAVLERNDKSTYTVTVHKDESLSIPSGEAALSFTDKTGAPGIINCLPPASPTVIDATFCFGLPGQLQAAASGGATIVWYDAPTAGNVLYTGNVLPLTPLYNNTAQYYAQAVSAENCPSARTSASYTVNHCVLNGYCPGFVAGNVGIVPTPAACNTYDSGKIGLVDYQAACEVFYPGRIGSENYPVACVSYDAGWIGKQN